MNKSRSDHTTPKPIQPEDALRSLTAGIGQLDGHRAAAYGELSTLRTAKQNSLERREKIYAVKYGASDRRVAHMQKQRETNTRLRQEIYVAHVQATTPSPSVDENGYVFHGFVRNSQRRPLSRLTVALYDEKGQWRRELGHGCTDENGYFILSFARDAKTVREQENKAADTAQAAKDAVEKAAASDDAQAKEKSKDSQKREEQAKAAAEATKAAGADADAPKKIQSGASAGMRTVLLETATRSRTAEIRVYNAEQKLVHRVAEPLTPELGRVDYREIIIDDSDGSCTPPPGSTDDPPPRAPAKPDAPRVRAPAAPAAVAPAPVEPQPPAPREGVSTPLENIKGVGPKTAAKIRATGIKDIEALKATKTEKLIEFAGTDKKVIRTAAKKRSTGAVAAKKKRK